MLTLEILTPWILFHFLVLALLALDLLFLNRKAHEIKFREALFWSAIYVSLALLFNVGVYLVKGYHPAVEFLTGYLIEISLSVDNLFVFLTIFTIFSVPRLHQHRVLFWGIIGAVLMRALFIFAGIGLVHTFHWMVYVFGGFLIVTGIKLLFQNETEKPDPQNYWPVKFAKRWLPFTDNYHGGKFFVRTDHAGHVGHIKGTPLFLVLIVIEIVDTIFAMDSVPAIIAITTDPFIVYTSNIFAILGLRSMYFALAGLIPLFHYLKYALSTILVFVGIKLVLTNIVYISTLLSLGVIGALLLFSIIASVLFANKTPKKT
ncbi:MAG: TerC family protein [Oligoflexia bacterium]|nr:TerC family protein [Oligoflexia bacterium]